MPRPLKVLVLSDALEPTSLDTDLRPWLRSPDWRAQADVLAALVRLGHQAECLAVFDDLELIREKCRRFRPDVIFNLADQLRHNRGFDQNLAAYLEVLGIPFTGCSSRGLLLCKDKALAKKILAYHGLNVPRFIVLPRGRRMARPAGLQFPLVVKPLREEASLGITQASFVRNEEQLRRQARWIHEHFDNDALVEEYIAGRELYAGVLPGRARPELFPLRELVFGKVPASAPRLATYRAKWDAAYRRRWGVRNQFARPLDAAVRRRIATLARLSCEALHVTGYVRLDLRLTADNEVYFLEANPNPLLAADEDFARAAQRAGLAFPQLVERILRLALRTVRD